MSKKLTKDTGAIDVLIKEIDRQWGTPADMLDTVGRVERLENIKNLEQDLLLLVKDRKKRLKKLLLQTKGEEDENKK